MEGPAKVDLPFNDIDFTSTQYRRRIGGFKQSCDAGLLGTDLVQKPFVSSAGVISVKTGQIFLTAAGLREEEHYAVPFWLTWGDTPVDSWDEWSLITTLPVSVLITSLCGRRDWLITL